MRPGKKCNTQGYKTSWNDYKLQIDTADCGVPIAAMLSSAAMHDSLAAIPLSLISAERVTNLYVLMDAANCSAELREHSRSLGRIPLIDLNPRRAAAGRSLRLKDKPLWLREARIDDPTLALVDLVDGGLHVVVDAATGESRPVLHLFLRGRPALRAGAVSSSGPVPPASVGHFANSASTAAREYRMEVPIATKGKTGSPFLRARAIVLMSIRSQTATSCSDMISSIQIALF